MRETMSENGGRTEISLHKLLTACFRNWWALLACVLGGALCAWCVSAWLVTPRYQASATMYVSSVSAGQPSDSVSATDLATAQKLVNTYAVLLESDAVLEKVAEAAGGELTPEELREAIDAARVEETELLLVTVTHKDPETAARIANAAVEAAPGEIGRFVEGSSARVVDRARVPLEPSAPNTGRNCLLGALAGLLIGVVCLTLRLLLDPHIRDEEDLNILTGVPVLGRIPELDGKHGDGEDLFLREAYKTLRTNLSFSLPHEGQCRVILVTSALRGEGRSAVSVNLAASCAMTGCRVLLVDCDLRCPSLGQRMGCDSETGLSSLLTDPGLRSRVIRPSGVEGLDILPAGTVPPNPSELIGSAEMGRLLTELREDYDCIILDSSPVSVVADGLLLAPLSDGVLVLARAGHSRRAAAAQALEQLKYTKAPILGLVFIGADRMDCGCGYGADRDGGCCACAGEGVRHGN